MGRYSSLRDKRSKKQEKDYGETLFKVLFIMFLIIGIAAAVIGWITSGWMSGLMITGISFIAASFIYKFMHSVIQLLKLVVIEERKTK